MGAQVAASFLVPIGYMKFSRGFEREADYLGIQYMYKTGYDPRELLAFFEKLQMQEKKQPGTLAKAFATHPQTRDRAHASEKEIASILPPLPEYVIDTSEFERVKAHLENIEGHLNGLKVRDVPVLIRRTSTNTQPVDGTQQAGSTTSPASDTPDPGRPTLRRQPSTGDSNP
jgi:predicted Zn-dependent protease